MIKKSKYKIGDRFGRLTIIADTGKRVEDGGKIFLCKCDCGNTCERRSDAFYQQIKQHLNSSCDECLNKENGKRLTYANKHKHPEWVENCRLGLYPFEGTVLAGIQRKNLNKNNHTGYRGVTFMQRDQKYYAQLMCQRVQHRSKGFDTLEEAIEARKELEKKYFKPLIERGTKLQAEEKKDHGNES